VGLVSVFCFCHVSALLFFFVAAVLSTSLSHWFLPNIPCSIVFFNLFMRPMVLHLLVASLPTPQAAVVASVLAWLDNVLWLLPAYALAFFISSTWYTEIGERTAMAAQRDIEQKLASRSGVVLPASTRPVQVSKPDWLTQLSRGLYWLLILSNFLIVVWLAPAVPYVGALSAMQ